MTLVALVSQCVHAKQEMKRDEVCTVESCRELQERLQTLEEVVKVIVRAFAGQKTEPFATINRAISKNPAVREIFSSAKATVKPKTESPPVKPTKKPKSAVSQASGSVAETKRPNPTSVEGKPSSRYLCHVSWSRKRIKSFFTERFFHQFSRIRRRMTEILLFTS